MAEFGLIPPKEIPEYMQMIARQFKRRRFYNPATGTFDERYSPLIQEDDFFLPMRPDGSGPDIDTLPGAENLDQIADIEYFKKKMIAPTKIPYARVGIGDGAGVANNKSLSQESSEFAKAVQWVQREVSTGLVKVGIIHLALRGYSIDDIKGFEVNLTASSAIEELYRIETWQTRVSVMSDLKDLGWFPKEWIVTHFTDLSPDEIEELKDMEEAAAGGGPGGGGPSGLGLGAPGEEGEPGAEDVPPEEGGEEAPEPGSEDDDLNLAGDEAIPAEQYDWNKERKVISELNKEGKRQTIMEIVRRWAERLGKDDLIERSNISSKFDYLLESKELDGLTKKHVDIKFSNNGDGEVHVEPFDVDKSDLIIDWSVSNDERESAIMETRNILLGEVDEVIEESEEITESDLP